MKAKMLLFFLIMVLPALACAESAPAASEITPTATFKATLTRLPTATSTEQQAIPTTAAAPPTPEPPPTAPPPTPTPQDAPPPEGRVTAPALNVRSGPDVDHDQVGQIHQNQTVPVLGCNSDGSWLMVDAGQFSGWVSAKYMAVSVPLDGLPIVAAPPPVEPEAPAPEREVATVLRVIDGDTIEVQIGDTAYTLRYIGIDTPETQHPEKPVEWMGQEATAANEALVGGQAVVLEKDVSETDQYGRLLRYVWTIDNVMANAELVRQGYAQAVTYPPDVKYADLFLELEREAREAGRGLWGPTPVPPTAPPPAPAGAAIRIIAVDKREEYVDIRNEGDEPQDLAGWNLVSEKRGDQLQDCPLHGVINPGETLRIWAMAEDQDKGGFNCGHGTNIWNNSKRDPAVLYNAAGVEVSRYGGYLQ